MELTLVQILVVEEVNKARTLMTEVEYKFKAFLCHFQWKLRLQVVSFYDNGRPCEKQGGCYTHV